MRILVLGGYNKKRKTEKSLQYTWTFKTKELHLVSRQNPRIDLVWKEKNIKKKSIIMVYLVRRFFAIYIDGVIIFILANLYYIIAQVLIGVEVSNVKTPDLDNLVLIGIFFIYFGLSEFFLDRTLGKKLLKFKITGFAEPKSWTRLKQILLRNVIRLIPIDPFSIFLNEEHRMWHDSISQTKVIDVRK